jgi:hypothetical protein
MGSMQPDALGAGRQSHLPGASSAGGPATSPSRATRAVSGRADRGARDRTGRAYVQAILERYVWLPVTPARVGPCDRRLARLLHQRGVPLATVLAALVIGGARRHFRRADAPELPPVRTLYYFLPVVEELRRYPSSEGYVEYLYSRLTPAAEAKAAACQAHTRGVDGRSERVSQGITVEPRARGTGRRLSRCFLEPERYPECASSGGGLA